MSQTQTVVPPMELSNVITGTAKIVDKVERLWEGIPAELKSTNKALNAARANTAEYGLLKAEKAALRAYKDVALSDKAPDDMRLKALKAIPQKSEQVAELQGRVDSDPAVISHMIVADGLRNQRKALPKEILGEAKEVKKSLNAEAFIAYIESFRAR